MDLFRKTAKAEFTQETEDSFKFNIMEYENLTEIFKDCDMLVSEGKIDGYWLSEMNLEDIFLMCSQNQEEGAGDKNKGKKK